MTEEPIIIEIDDTQLDAALLKLDLLGTKGDKVLGRGQKLGTALPGINRELRLILGQVPGMREAMRAYFALKRVERGAALLRLGQTLPLLLTTVATVILLLREYQQLVQKQKQQQKDYERLIRRARGWTHDEYVRGQAEWQEYRKSMPG